jgi:hypothetical protein
VDIGQWLRGLGLQSYEEAFRNNGVDLDRRDQNIGVILAEWPHIVRDRGPPSKAALTLLRATAARPNDKGILPLMARSSRFGAQSPTYRTPPSTSTATGRHSDDDKS